MATGYYIYGLESSYPDNLMFCMEGTNPFHDI